MFWHTKLIRWAAPAALRRGLALLLLLLANGRGWADEFDDLRVKWRDLTTGGTNLSLADSLVQSRLSSLASSANSYWGSMNTSAGRTYLWSDAARTNKSQDITTCYNRLNAMALAWATRGCSLEGNAPLAAAVLDGLDWLYTNRYNETITTAKQYDNWWDWEIGSPQKLNDTALLMYDVLAPAQLTNYLRTLDNFNDPGKNGWMTGANTTDKCLVAAIRGILGRSSAKLAAARDRLSPVFPYVTSGDGFYTDGSFIQHTRHPYTGSYGTVLVSGVSRMMILLAGSTWAVTNSAQTNVFRWICDSYEPFIYKGAMMDFLRGRAISRQGSQDHSGGAGDISNILRISQFAPTNDALAFKRMMKYSMQADTFRSFSNNAPLSLLQWTRDLLNDTNITPRGELIGHYQFPNMDRVVHLRPGFGFSLSLSSSRIYTYESINSENLHGWFTGDGMTYLYNADLGQFSANFWPTVDPYHLAGTTVDQTARTNASGQSATTGQNWVGGAALAGSWGVVGMSLDAQVSTLVAKKSWFLFDNEIVCLGAGITCTTTGAVHTTIENRRLSAGPTNSFYCDGVAMSTNVGWSSNLTGATWCALAGAGGYYFPGGASLQALRERRTNNWYDINQNSQPTSSLTNPVSETFVKLWFNHGVAPTNASYAYTLLPNASAADTATYAANPGAVVLSNTPNVQAVRQAALGIVAANFWMDGTNSADFITVNRKSSVVTREATNVLQVAISDPTQTNTGAIVLTLSRAANSVLSVDPGVTVLQTTPVIQLSVTTSGAKGKSFQAAFALQTNILAAADARATAAGTPVVMDVLANDAPSQHVRALSLASVTQPAHGVATIAGDLVTYAPAYGFTGADNFTYAVTDGYQSATGAVSVTVGAPELLLTPPMVSASTNDGNLPINTLDNDLGTRWSALGVGQWIQYDLLSLHLVDAVSIAFYAGNTRVSYFDVNTSRDGTNWTPVLTGQSSGTTTNLERFDCTNSWARHVRIVGRGNNQSTWNSFTEVRVHTASNAPPLAAADAIVTNSVVPLSLAVQANDADPDAGPQPLALVSVTQPAWGAATLTNGAIRFTPPANFCGTASFNYAVTDGFLTSTGAVVVTVNANLAPALASIPNASLIAGQTLCFTNTANDVNVPAQTLSFSLLQGPTNAALNPSNGVFTWRPTLAQATGATPFTLAVFDNGTLSLGATQRFAVTVSPPQAPRLTAPTLTGGQFGFWVSGDAGPDYTLLASTNLLDWTSLLTTNPPALPLFLADPEADSHPSRFYQIRLGP